jgi:single-strand DNA-binding protein
MPTFNQVFIKGNLTKKPELSYTPQGTPVAKSSIAVNEKFKNAKKETIERVGFFDIVIWNKLAETCAENLDKGQEVIIIGRLRYERWEDKEKAPHHRISIIVSQIYFGRKAKGEIQDEHPEDAVDYPTPQTEDQDELPEFTPL